MIDPRPRLLSVALQRQHCLGEPTWTCDGAVSLWKVRYNSRNSSCHFKHVGLLRFHGGLDYFPILNVKLSFLSNHIVSQLNNNVDCRHRLTAKEDPYLPRWVDRPWTDQASLGNMKRE